jgi:adenine phosphoribosyltransferase
MELLLSTIRNIPDFPKPGIIFKDITPLLSNPEAFKKSIESLKKRIEDLEIDQVVAIESRGFIFGSALAYELGVGLTLVRKPKKLPFTTSKVEYALEYGTDSLEMHTDALKKGDRVVIVDDILATGGTAKATAKLAEQLGAKVEALLFLSELGFLNGRSQLHPHRVESILTL